MAKIRWRRDERYWGEEGDVLSVKPTEEARMFLARAKEAYEKAKEAGDLVVDNGEIVVAHYTRTGGGEVLIGPSGETWQTMAARKFLGDLSSAILAKSGLWDSISSMRRQSVSEDGERDVAAEDSVVHGSAKFFEKEVVLADVRNDRLVVKWCGAAFKSIDLDLEGDAYVPRCAFEMLQEELGGAEQAQLVVEFTADQLTKSPEDRSFVARVAHSEMDLEDAAEMLLQGDMTREDLKKEVGEFVFGLIKDRVGLDELLSSGDPKSRLMIFSCVISNSGSSSDYLEMSDYSLNYADTEVKYAKIDLSK
ncbi:MAG: hypothetical protein KatS3mg109_0100 [Pirellulaceae bacterium]|nr:MAG: hypothetical protein KatS3mg109_0100 [Pirellulaceae bacterium]